MSYYTKYRPQTIGELDLVSVRQSLSSIFKSGKFSQAYLFTGPKGTGKTSSARIVAKLLNCEKNDGHTLAEPCNKCENCRRITNGSSLVCLEMDAASNRGIDDVRSLRERIGLAPAEGRYTVYIIDEVHMLTTEAFNALLKTLEEPPAHAVFILCTTDPQKIPETVISRCTRVQFFKATKDEVLSSLNKAVVGEKLEIEEAGLSLIATSVDGSFRDGMKILEQLANQSEGKVTLAQVKEMVGVGKGYETDSLVKALLDRDMETILAELAKREKMGVDPYILGKQLLEQIRLKLMEAVIEAKVKPVDLLQLAETVDQMVVRMKVSALPGLVLEAGVVNWCFKEQKQVERKVIVEVKKQQPVKMAILEPVQPVQVEEPKSLFEGKVEQVDQKWPEILAAVKPLNHSLEALLKSARPVGLANGTLRIEAFYKFHKEQLEQEKHRRKLEEAMSVVLGGRIRLEIVLGQQQAKQEPVVEEDNELVKAAEEIFG